MLSNTPTIDLHGLDRDYASICVKDFINDHYTIGNTTILIIHGKGSGILRKKIHEDLRKNKYVQKYELNMFNSGETIVTLKVK